MKFWFATVVFLSLNLANATFVPKSPVIEESFEKLKKSLKSSDHKPFMYAYWLEKYKSEDEEQIEVILKFLAPLSQNDSGLAAKLDEILVSALEKREGPIRVLLPSILSFDVARKQQYYAVLMAQYENQNTPEYKRSILQILGSGLADSENVYSFFQNIIYNKPDSWIKFEEWSYAVCAVLKALFEKSEVLEKRLAIENGAFLFRVRPNEIEKERLAQVNQDFEHLREKILTKQGTPWWMITDLANLGYEIDLKHPKMSWLLDLLKKYQPILRTDSWWRETSDTLDRTLKKYEPEKDFVPQSAPELSIGVSYLIEEFKSETSDEKKRAVLEKLSIELMERNAQVESFFLDIVKSDTTLFETKYGSYAILILLESLHLKLQRAPKNPDAASKSIYRLNGRTHSKSEITNTQSEIRKVMEKLESQTLFPKAYVFELASFGLRVDLKQKQYHWALAQLKEIYSDLCCRLHHLEEEEELVFRAIQKNDCEQVLTEKI